MDAYFGLIRPIEVLKIINLDIPFFIIIFLTYFSNITEIC